MSLWTMPAAELLAQTASASPTPGGGSVACVCGAMGTALVAMALEITVRTAPADRVDEIQGNLGRLHALLAVMQGHADRDVEVFGRYMAALALPRADPAAVQARKAAIADAALDATTAPLDAAADLARALEIAVTATGLARRQVVSDVLAGADLVRGAVHAVLRNVDINLSGIADREVAEALARRRAELAASVDALHARTVAASP